MTNRFTDYKKRRLETLISEIVTLKDEIATLKADQKEHLRQIDTLKRETENLLQQIKHLQHGMPKVSVPPKPRRNLIQNKDNGPKFDVDVIKQIMSRKNDDKEK